jgi:hypothetical protein
MNSAEQAENKRTRRAILAVGGGAFGQRGSGWLLNNWLSLCCCMGVGVLSWFGAAAIPEHPDSGFKE